MKKEIIQDKYAILSCSGGMDSSTLLLRCLKDGYKCKIVNFNYGSVQNNIEHTYLFKNITYLSEKGYNVDYQSYDLSSVMGNFKSSLIRDNMETPKEEYNSENQPTIFVDNRNMIFYSLVAGIASTLYRDTECEVKIAMGVHARDNNEPCYPDCTPEFFKLVHQAFKSGNYENKVELFIPYANQTKLDILKDGFVCCKELGLDFNEFYKNTISCYTPVGDKSCGECPTCLERLNAFKSLGLEDPTQYIK